MVSSCASQPALPISALRTRQKLSSVLAGCVPECLVHLVWPLLAGEPLPCCKRSRCRPATLFQRPGSGGRDSADLPHALRDDDFLRGGPRNRALAAAPSTVSAPFYGELRNVAEQVVPQLKRQAKERRAKKRRRFTIRVTRLLRNLRGRVAPNRPAQSW